MKTLFLLLSFFTLVYAGGSTLQTSDEQKKFSQIQLQQLNKKIGNNPKNIEDRIKLIHHYIAVNDKDQVKTLAAQIFKIKPNEPRVSAILKKHHIQPDPVKKKKHTDASKHKNDAFFTLQMYYKHSEYRLFMDLFKLMEKNNAIFPKEILFAAIDSAIEMRKYKLAQKIVQDYDFPHTKNYKKFVSLLQEKLTAL